ncbi:MAG: hypothetical protein A2511_02930 [Deltaproteobacteria bacterium RIFOXYD12_FULL_50_9]|nr:MAG: hypothetical protein A2511_02930 [Deltaproteobacteria bacterium RIFOXYD12_FULL_50_9]
MLSAVDMLEFHLNQALKPGKPGRPRKKTGDIMSLVLHRFFKIKKQLKGDLSFSKAACAKPLFK